MKLFESAGLAGLALFFVANTTAQQIRINLNRNACEVNSIYVAFNTPVFASIETVNPNTNCWSAGLKNVKLSSADFDIKKLSHNGIIFFSLIPLHTGKCEIVATAKNKEGTKLRYITVLEAVELPSLSLETWITSADKEFLWLRLRDQLTGENMNDHYNLCVLHYELNNADHQLKESGSVGTGTEFFPSIQLRELGIRFVSGDLLKIKLSVIHKNYGLIQTLPETELIIP